MDKPFDISGGRKGHGLAVHAISDFGPICGSGKNSKGTRKSFRSRITNEAITCPKCLRIMALKPEQWNLVGAPQPKPARSAATEAYLAEIEAAMARSGIIR